MDPKKLIFFQSFMKNLSSAKAVELNLSDKPLTCAKFSSKGILSVGSADKSIKICSINADNEFNICQTLLGHEAGVNDLDWLPGDSYITTCSDDKSLKLWDLQTGQCVSTLLGHKGFAFSVKHHPYTGLIVSSGFDNTIRYWDPRQSFEIGATSIWNSGISGETHYIEAHSDPVISIDISANGREVLSGSLDGTVRIWDFTFRNCLLTLHAENKPAISSCCYCPDNNYVMVSSMDSMNRMWNVVRNDVPVEDRVVVELAGRKCVKYNAFTKCLKGRNSGEVSFISGDEDGKILVWNIHSKSEKVRSDKRTEQPNFTILEHNAPVLAVDGYYSSQSLRVVSGDLNGRLCVHDIFEINNDQQ